MSTSTLRITYRMGMRLGTSFIPKVIRLRPESESHKGLLGILICEIRAQENSVPHMRYGSTAEERMRFGLSQTYSGLPVVTDRLFLSWHSGLSLRSASHQRANGIVR